MMRFAIRAVLAAALCCVATAGGVAAASGAAALSPLDGSDAVLRQHARPAGEYRVQYRVERDGGPVETVAVGVAADYDYDDGTRGHNVRDYRERRVYRVTATHGLANDSLYAQVWYRAAELQNRIAIAGAIRAAGIDQGGERLKLAATTDPFWQETELGLVHPSLPRPQLTRRDDGGRTRWLRGEGEVVAARFDGEPVPAAARAGLKRLWLQIARIHPQIADELCAGGRMPAELWVLETSHSGQPPVTAHWTASGARWLEAAPFPLAAGLAAEPTSSGGAFAAVYDELARAVRGRLAPPPPATYAERAQAAIARGAGVEAYLWVIEMSLAAGVQSGACAAQDASERCMLLARVKPLLLADPRRAAITAPAAPDAATRAAFDDVPNAYLQRLLWATRPPAKDVPVGQGEQDLLAALRASPVANFTKDTGDYYLQHWQPAQAWQVWDLGRRMAGHRDGDLLESVAAVERELERKLPDYFRY